MNKDQQKKIEEILGSLDGTQRAETPDFFYTRLKARMEREHEPVAAKRPWILRPAYALGALVIILVANVLVIFNSGPATNNTVAGTENDDSESMQALAAEYSLNNNNILYYTTQGK